MNPAERGPGSLSDADMDALLKEFFQNEMPVELRQASAAPQLVSVHRDTHRRNRRQTSWLSLSVVAGSLLTVMVLLSQPSPRSPSGSVPKRPVASSPGQDTSDIERTVNEDFDDIDRYDTADGPVELRSKLRIKNVSIFDPDTGVEVELSLPELEIEIFPIDDEQDDTDGATANRGGAKFRFQLQPKIEGAKRRLHLRLQQLGEGPGAVHAFELDLGTDREFRLDINQLLKNDLLNKELEKLPPEIRKRVESLLRKAQISKPKVRVRQSK